MYYIGVDLGTSAVKLLLMTGDGTIEKITSREYPLSFPQSGWSEQDPSDWWNAVVDGIQELCQHLPPSDIAGISFGGQMHGLVILDSNDQVIRPAILWNDGRTDKETHYLNEQIGEDKLASLTGNIAFAGFTAPKILWLKENEPDSFARICKIMLPKDFIAYKMTGVHSCDYSDAAGMLLLDTKNRCWSKEMLDICGVNEAMMPTLYESYEVTGTLTSDVADLLGLSTACKVCAGAGDNAAAAIGTGTVGAGTCNISLGTSGTIFIPSETFCLPKGYSLHSFCHADGAYHLMGCILSAASCNKWWMEDILDTKDFASEQKDIDKLGHNNVFFLPYLMGERSPHNDPSARAAFIGISMDTTRADLTQAVLEGVAFALKDCYEIAKGLGIPIKETKICGGGAKSPLWRKIIANVLNIPVVQVENEEGPGLGAAILAAVGCGEYATVQDAVSKIVNETTKEEPDEKLALLYEERYQVFRTLYPALN